MTVILCHCTHRHLLDPAVLASCRGALLSSAVELLEVGDLCDVALSPPGALAAALRRSDTVVCGCHHRSLRALTSLVTAASVPSARTVDLRSGGLSAALDALGLAEVAAAADAPPPVELAGGDAWYPLIDRERCSDCGRCSEFCLFGVYRRVDSGRVLVPRPLNCKPNCPACARICPRNAIIFPKSEDMAINGADVSPGALVDARIRLDPEDLASGDIYAKLKARRQSRALPPLFRQGLFKDTSTNRPGADDSRHEGQNS